MSNLEYISVPNKSGSGQYCRQYDPGVNVNSPQRDVGSSVESGLLHP